MRVMRRCIDGLVLHQEPDPERADGGLVTVTDVKVGSLAAWGDVVAGDHLETIISDALCSKKLRKVLQRFLHIARDEADPTEAEELFPRLFPVAFEFRGPACREILEEGMAALHNAAHASRVRKQQQAAAVATGKLVVVKRPVRAPETCWPKRSRSHHHAVVLPTLLVREGKSPSRHQPLAPIHEPHVAASRAAARVTALRRAKSTEPRVVAREGQAADAEAPPQPQLRQSVSLPALVCSEQQEQEAPKAPRDPTWSRRHWLPENVSILQSPPTKATQPPKAVVRSLLPTTKLSAVQHSLVF